MFHRANGRAIKPQSKKAAAAQNEARQDAQKIGMDQTAVRQYHKPQKEGEDIHSANQNSGVPYAVQQGQKSKTKPTTNQKTKEARQMNNPQTKNQQPENQPAAAPSQPQARVDIPGNNFQRPGQGNRPSYPGASYPGAQSQSGASYNPSANDAASGRQLSIGQGITMSGEIEACDHLVVEGTVEAALKGASLLEITESGSFFGTVEIEEATIAGRFEGDITARGRLTIEATGVVIGTVSYKELSMEAGATLDGSVSPIGSENTVRQSAGGKKAAPKAKKVSNNDGQELPFSDRAAAE